MSDSNDDLRSKYENNSVWADRIALLIVVGLVVEIAAVFILQKPLLEAILTTSATALIACGVWGELWFAKRAKEAGDGMVAEANARAAEANQKAQEAILELARLREKGELTADAVLATAQATKANALAAQYLLELSKQLAQLMAPGMNMPGFLSVEQYNRIVSKVKPFAGKQFDQDVDITSRDLERVGLAGAIGAALEKAGWVNIALRHPSGVDASVRGIIIEADASKNSKLLDAAETLSSALNAEGIAATVNPKTETDTTNVIHILVGPKP